MTDQATPASHATAGGKVDLGSGKAQHVDLWRKLKLRRELIDEHAIDGAAYVPFLGEGDIAVELYAGRRIVGVELEPAVAAVARDRLAAPFHERPLADGWMPLVIVGDANVWHDEAETAAPFAIVDVDAFANPYPAIAAWWEACRPTARVVLFGTDGMRLATRQSKSRVYANLVPGKLTTAPIAEKRLQYNNWWKAMVLPWLAELVGETHEVSHTRKYVRDHMVYWGAVIDPIAARREESVDVPRGTREDDQVDDAAPASDIAKVEQALLEAAQSGNVPAAIFWLEHKGGPTWTKAAKTNAAETQLEALLGTKRRE